jgi:hypothetical protein
MRPAVVGAVAVGVIGAVVALVGSSAQVRLAEDIGGKARGAYDILVRPAAQGGVSTTQGLVEPNFLSFSGSGGISLSQLAAVRAVEGVQVAAPISVVGQVTSGVKNPVVSLPPSKVSRIYRFTVTQHVSDGVSSRLVSTQSFESLLARSGDRDSTSTGPDSYVGWDASTGWFLVGFPLPPVSSSVVAVDPVAEEALVGHPVTALTELAGLRDRTSGSFNGQTIREAVDAAIKDKKLSPNASLTSAAVASHVPGSVVPVIVTDADPSSGTVEITADVLAEGKVVDAALAHSDAPKVLAAWPDSSPPVKVMKQTIPADLRPLGAGNIVFTLDGATNEGTAGGGLTQADGLLLDRPTYRSVESAGRELHLEIAPTGLVPMTGPQVELRPPPGSGLDQVKVTGSEQAYRKTATIQLAGQTSYFPIAGFTASDLVPSAPDEGRVSLGAYDVPPITIASSTVAAAGTTMLPTLNPAGLVVRQPVAIADLRDAELLRGPTPIDAIRVRVAGIDRVDEAATRRVENVASRIADLGLDVDVVIGSSPQDVSIDVPDYVVGPGDATADLGTVTQRWTTMGAATTVTRGLTGTTRSLATLAALAALIATLAAHLLEASSARRDAAILRVTGWSRGAIRRRFLTAPLIAATAALGLIGAAWLAGARDPAVGTIGLTLGLLSPCATLIGAFTINVEDPIGGSRAGETSARTPRLPVSSISSLARRMAFSTPARSGALAGLLAVTSAAGGLAVVTYLARADAAGPTVLGTTLTYTLTGVHLTLAALVFVTGIGFALWLWHYAIAHGKPGSASLVASGWASTDLRRLWQTLLAWIALPATILGAGIAALLSALTETPQAGTAAAVTLATGLILSLGMAISAKAEGARS